MLCILSYPTLSNLINLYMYVATKNIYPWVPRYMCTSILVTPSLFSSVVDYGSYLTSIPRPPFGYQTLPIGCLFCPQNILNACQVVVLATLVFSMYISLSLSINDVNM